MSKGNIKSNTQHILAIKYTAQKWCVTERFVRSAVKRERDSLTAEQIRLDYLKFYDDIMRLKPAV